MPPKPGHQRLAGRKASEWPGPAGWLLAPRLPVFRGCRERGTREAELGWVGRAGGSCASSGLGACRAAALGWAAQKEMPGVQAGVSGVQVVGVNDPILSRGCRQTRCRKPEPEEGASRWRPGGSISGADPSEASPPAARLPGGLVGAVRPDAQARPRAQLAPPGPFPLLSPTSRGGD